MLHQELTDGQLADLEVSLTEQLASVCQEIEARRELRVRQAVEQYRSAGKLQGFALLVAERKANDESLSAVQRRYEMAQRRVDSLPLEGLL